MKKTLALLLAACALLGLLAGCSASPDEETLARIDDMAARVEAAEEKAAALEAAKAAAEEEAAAVMTHEEYMAADIDSPVTIETYVQATQSWWEDQITVYAQSEDGAYFIYNMACPEADADKLVPGTHIRVSGYKAEWSGEIEIADASFEIIDGDGFIAEPEDVTALLGSDKLIDHQNEFVSFTGLTVVASEAADGSDAAFLYNWDGSGEDGNDLYFNVSLNDEVYTFTVESYLCGAGTEVYEAVKSLKIGDTVDMEGFLYWYEGVNPHITSVTVVEAE